MLEACYKQIWTKIHKVEMTQKKVTEIIPEKIIRPGSGGTHF